MALTSMLSFAQLPDNPAPQPSAVTKWHELHEQPRHRIWFVRHPLATEMIVLGAAGALIMHYKWPHSCATKIDGVPYSGTPPCPKSCEGPGDCYWGGTTK